LTEEVSNLHVRVGASSQQTLDRRAIVVVNSREKLFIDSHCRILRSDDSQVKNDYLGLRWQKLLPNSDNLLMGIQRGLLKVVRALWEGLLGR